jgi:hypothetical protein
MGIESLVTSHSGNSTLHIKMSYLVGCLKIGIKSQVTSHSENPTLHARRLKVLGDLLEISWPSYKKSMESFRTYHLDTICEDKRITCG